MISNFKTYACLATVISLLTVAGLSRWETYSVKKELVEVTAKLNAIDLKAKEDEIKYKGNADVIKDKDAEYRAAIAYYERMLHPKNNPSPSDPAKDTAGVDEAPGQPTITGCPIQAELRCLEDARVRAGMAEHFRINQYPIE